MNYSAPQMAEHFGCSVSLVYRKLYEAGLKQRDRYSNTSEASLDERVDALQAKFPNAGSVMMSGYLQTQSVLVQRRKVRESLTRVSPLPVVNRLAKTIKRRQYSVAMTNSMWHLDAHMKLNRWGISTHGCIDGYSRLIPFLSADTNNKAKTVLEHFVAACSNYGVPSRVRTDHGGENIMVALFMNLMNGPSRHSNITGRSVHNQRIERLWKDVFNQVIEKFYHMFYMMEDRGLLDAENKAHIVALQIVYMPIINEELELFRKAWNNHKISTANNKTPNMLWVSGVLKNINSEATPVTNLFGESVTGRLESQLRSYGLNPNEFNDVDQEDPEEEEIITEEQKNTLISLFTPEMSTEQKYNRTLEFFTSIGII